MATSGAAPLIVSASGAARPQGRFQTGDAGRASMQLPSEAVHRTSPPDVAGADHAGARPYQHRCAGTRSRHAMHLQRRRRERILTCAGRQSSSVLSFFRLHTNDLTYLEKKALLSVPFLEHFLDMS
jgi:hypothetical protein